MFLYFIFYFNIFFIYSFSLWVVFLEVYTFYAEKCLLGELFVGTLAITVELFKLSLPNIRTTELS